MNTTGQGKVEDMHGGSVPLETRIELEGSLNVKRVRLIKDDGCNTNVESRESLKNNSELFEVVKRPIEVMLSEENAVKKASEVILGAELCIGTHVYKSNWVIAR